LTPDFVKLLLQKIAPLVFFYSLFDFFIYGKGGRHAIQFGVEIEQEPVVAHRETDGFKELLLGRQREVKSGRHPVGQQ